MQPFRNGERCAQPNDLIGAILVGGAEAARADRKELWLQLARQSYFIEEVDTFSINNDERDLHSSGARALQLGRIAREIRPTKTLHKREALVERRRKGCRLNECCKHR